MATSNVDRQGGLAVGLSQGLTDPAWDRFVAGAAGGGHLQTTAWARVKATLGWDATRIAVWSGDELVAGCQVLEVLRVLPQLELAGLVQWTGSGWRLTPPPKTR